MVYFVYFILPPAILFLGLFGNTMGFLVLFRQKLDKIGPGIIYKFLFFMDTIYLLEIIPKYLIIPLMNLDNDSSFWCKFNRYFNFSLAAISPMLRIYMSIEKFISIRYSNKRFILNKSLSQILFSAVVFVYNALYYLPLAFYQDIVDHFVPSNGTNQTSNLFCDFISLQSQTVISLMDFINLVAVPFVIMITFSILLIKTIFASRLRVMANYTNRENKTFQKDIKLSVTTIVLNLIFLILNMPIVAIAFTTNFNGAFTTDFIFYLCMYIFFASYAFNFYIIVLTNSLFRSEFLNMLFRRNVHVPNRTT